MEISQTEIASLVSQRGDEYFALLLVPSGSSNRIVVGRGVSEIEAHEQLVSELANLASRPVERLHSPGVPAPFQPKLKNPRGQGYARRKGQIGGWRLALGPHHGRVTQIFPNGPALPLAGNPGEKQPCSDLFPPAAILSIFGRAVIAPCLGR
jgi:hypothetical protein